MRLRPGHSYQTDLPRVLVANNLDVDRLVGAGTEHTLNEVLIHPRFEFTHPIGQKSKYAGCGKGIIDSHRKERTREYSWRTR